MPELFHIEGYELLLLLAGLTLVGAVWIPQLLVKRYITVATLYLLAGMAIYAIPGLRIPSPLQEDGRWLWEKLTEFIVIVSLLGAGLKIRLDLRHPFWHITWRLLLITMPISIGLTMLVGWWVLGVAPVTALLLGAVLAPTDPVLAGDIQVGPPDREDTDAVRFALTSEAGLNDGLAFPFTYLAITAALLGLGNFGEWGGEWFLKYVLYKMVVGVVAGVAVGWVLSKVIFTYPRDHPLSKEGMGCLAIFVLFVSYGLAEIAAGYGFIAVFVGAYTLRSIAVDHKYHLVLYDFAENLERVVMGLVLILSGGLLVELLPFMSWTVLLGALLILLVIRPLGGMLALIGCAWPIRDRLAISFYGIRGIGSIYYLAYAVGVTYFADMEIIWATLMLTIALSSVLHGLSAYHVMRYLDNRAEDAHDRPEIPDDQTTLPN